MTRTDIHRPSAIVPEDYIEIAYLPHGDDPGSALYRREQYKLVEAHMKQHGGYWSGHEHGGSCEICGNRNAMTYIVFWHEKSNTYIRSGEICADKLGLCFDREGLNLFRKKLADERMHRAGMGKAKATLLEKGLAWAWETWLRLAGRDSDGNLLPKETPTLPLCVGCGTPLGVGSHYQGRFVICGACACQNEKPKNPFHRHEFTAADVVSKLVRYGSLSDAQYGLLGKLPGWIEQDRAHQARREQENAHRAATSRHLGTVGARLEFTATIRFTTFIETARYGYGQVSGFTITVMDDQDGNVIVWKGTGFGAEKGSTIRFKATVKEHAEREGVKQTIVTRAKQL